MTVHLIKIAAGLSSLSELRERFESYGYSDPNHGFIVPVPTRNFPKQREALLGGGSIYWIIKGEIKARTQFVDIREEEDADGRRLCRLCVLGDLKLVVPTKRRGFQGWRYLKAGDAPADLDISESDTDGLDADMAAELNDLGLL